jgi:hypothetical protein
MASWHDWCSMENNPKAVFRKVDKTKFFSLTIAHENIFLFRQKLGVR